MHHEAPCSVEIAFNDDDIFFLTYVQLAVWQFQVRNVEYMYVDNWLIVTCKYLYITKINIDIKKLTNKLLAVQSKQKHRQSCSKCFGFKCEKKLNDGGY